MTEPSENPRLEQFRADIAKLKLKEPNPARDAQRLRIGGALAVAGIAIGIIAFLVSHSATDPLQQRDAIIVAITGVSLTVAGSAMYLRYALTQFLRLWLARFLFETTKPFSVDPPVSSAGTATENGLGVSRGDPTRQR